MTKINLNAKELMVMRERTVPAMIDWTAAPVAAGGARKAVEAKRRGRLSGRRSRARCGGALTRGFAAWAGGACVLGGDPHARRQQPEGGEREAGGVAR